MSGGRRGPAPKPSAIRKAEGNRGHRPLPKREPMPPKGFPSKPEWIARDAVASPYWDEQGERLFEMGVLTIDDGPALASLCRAFSMMRRLEEKLHLFELGDERMMGKDTGGNIFENPFLKPFERWYDRHNAMLKEFGQTPSSRTRVQVKEKPIQDLRAFLLADEVTEAVQ